MSHTGKPQDPYALVDIDVTQALPEMPLPKHLKCITGLVRRKGKPVHFWIEALRKGSAFTVFSSNA